MTRPRIRKRPTRRANMPLIRHDRADTAGSGGVPDGASIDALYGLEPVFEPARETSAAAGGTRFERIACPYCGESFETLLDLSAGSASYIEDCQICCRPMQFELDVDPEGTLVALTVRRGDD